MKPFIVQLAAWLKPQSGDLSDQFLEGLLDQKEYGRKLSKSKAISKVLANMTDGLLTRKLKGREFGFWLDNLFEKIALQASGRETLYVGPGPYLEEESGFLTVTGKFIGDEQDEDTEVPAELNTVEIERVFKELGAKKIRVDWEIRKLRDIPGLNTVYSYNASFPTESLMKALLSESTINRIADTVYL